MTLRRAVTIAMAALVASVAPRARASTGVCDSNPPTTTQACIDAIQSSGGVVNDIFKDANGRTALQLPLFAKLYNPYGPSCDRGNSGCNPGISLGPAFDCPGNFTCTGSATPPFATVASEVAALDRTWANPCRLSSHVLDANGCPAFGTCVTDGTPGSYFPWEGMIFDLGGPSNQVAIFASNDHGPQPCESLEYTVFLTDNPKSTNLVLAPAVSGADPSKWNRAVLKKIFTQGWIVERPADPSGHAACGDTALYSVEEDSMVSLYTLPCGINFRYAALVAGNDGLDFPACAYDSLDAELDAVAGLTESGAAVCPDADKDGFVDCNCPGAPASCDCDDGDPDTHPGAPEACDAPKDYNCNKITPEPCPPGKTCNLGLCLATCANAEFACPAGSTCADSDAGVRLCVPNDCTIGGCPPGSTCDAAQKKCVPSCTGVVCPTGMHCVGGECVDPCRQVSCPSGTTCRDGVCEPPCNCFAGNAGCGDDAGTSCDRAPDGGDAAGATNVCVPPSCVGVTCPPGQHCDGPQGCVDYCSGVKCPPGEECVPPPGIGGGGDGGLRYGCVDLCAGVSCPIGSKCDPTTGKCGAVAATDAGGLAPDDAGAPVDATAPDAGDSFGADRSDKGCSCATVGGGEGGALAGVLASLGVGIAFAGRRRRRARR